MLILKKMSFIYLFAFIFACESKKTVPSNKLAKSSKKPQLVKKEKENTVKENTVKENTAKEGRAKVSKNPQIYFEKRSYNAGEVKQGHKIEHEFIVKNKGLAELNIQKVKGS